MEKIFFYTKEPAAFNFHSLLFKRELEKTLKTHTHTQTHIPHIEEGLFFSEGELLLWEKDLKVSACIVFALLNLDEVNLALGYILYSAKCMHC